MLKSHLVEEAGRFLGVAVSHETAWRFVAADPAVRDIDGAVFSSPEEAKRVARQVLARESRPSAEMPSRVLEDSPARDDTVEQDHSATRSASVGRIGGGQTS